MAVMYRLDASRLSSNTVITIQHTPSVCSCRPYTDGDAALFDNGTVATYGSHINEPERLAPNTSNSSIEAALP